MLRGPPLPPLRCQTLVELLASAARSPHFLTFVDAREEESALPFVDLEARAAKAAAGIAALGIERGDRVAQLVIQRVELSD